MIIIRLHKKEPPSFMKFSMLTYVFSKDDTELWYERCLCKCFWKLIINVYVLYKTYAYNKQMFIFIMPQVLN